MLFRSYMPVFFFFISWVWAQDVPVVENGLSPKGNRFTLSLREDLRIAPNDEDTQLIWTSEQTNLAVNDQGHIFVADVAENRIIELDSDGNFVKQIGRRGEGPGEFRSLRSLQFLADGSGFVFENFQILCVFNRFDAHMKFIDRTETNRFDRIFKTVLMDPHGRHFFSTYVTLERGATYDSVTSGILDRDLNLKRALSTTRTSSVDPQRINEPQFWVEYLAKMLEENAQGMTAFVAFDENGGFYSAVANRYEITHWDPDLNKTMMIRRKIEPIRFSESERDAFVNPMMDSVREALPENLQRIVTDNVIKRAVARAEFPPFKNPISGITRFQDKLIVIGDVDRQADVSHNDLYDQGGRFLGSFDHTFFGMTRMVFWGDYAYALELNESDDNVLVRYKVELAPK